MRCDACLQLDGPCPSCAKAALATLQAENAELRKERDDYRAKAWTRFELVQAAEGERDRLRELLREGLGRTPCQEFCGGWDCRARAYLAATPHTEGEASAPPKSKEPG